MALMQDLKFAARLMVKDPWFTLVAVLALSLGIGMNTTVFTFVNAVLIRGLPYEGSHLLYHIDMRNTATGRDMAASWPEFQEFKSRTKTFTEMAAFRGTSANVTEPTRPPERIQGAGVTPNLFRLLRVQPMLGRDFTEKDAERNAPPVVVIGHTIWKNRYNSDPAVVGQVVELNDVSTTIVGVMPDGFRFPSNHDLWRPLIPSSDTDRADRSIRIMGRLSESSSRAEGFKELSGIAAQWRTQYPTTNKDVDAQVLTFNERFNGGPIRIVFLALLGAVGFVLLIACANVANLLLARSTKRAREVAIRFALGASRARVIRQLLIESTMLAFVGGAVGLFLSWFGIRAFDAAVADSGKPYWIIFSMDLTVFGYMALVCLLTGMIFGVMPALQVSKTNVNEILKEGGRGSTGGRRAHWLRSGLIISELALTVVLLIGAGLMMRSFLKLYNLDLGVDSDHLMTMRADLPGKKFDTAEKRRLQFEQILAKVKAVPGVRNATLADTLPMGGGGRANVEIEGRAVESTTTPAPVSTVTVTPEYFDTVGMSLRRGRSFTATDGAPGAESVIVNERFAARFFPTEDAIGHRFRLSAAREAGSKPGPWLTIVGVSPTIRQGDPQALEPDAVVYQPYRQFGYGSMVIVARTDGAPTGVSSAMRNAVQQADPDQAVYGLQSMNQVLEQIRWPYRVFGSMFAIFAVVALALSAVGIYAVTSYAVTQRTPEIGVRMALGAQPGQVWWMILRQGMLQLAIGLTIGLVAGWPLSKILQVLVVQIPATDPVTFGIVAGLLALVMLAACLVPARRATRLDPISALRVD
jgi:putative ABC transport system permease protein